MPLTLGQNKASESEAPMRLFARTAQVGILVTSCFLIVACADFFKSDKSGGSNKGDNSLLSDFQKPNEGAFTEQKMLINIGVNVLARNAEHFAAQAFQLQDSLNKYCSALEEDVAAPLEEAIAKKDFERTMMAYQQVATAPIGPLHADQRLLETRLYSWPLFNGCNVDQKVAAHVTTKQSVENLPLTERGLTAIEYLLFEDTLNSTCNPRAKLPAIKAWNERTGNQKKLDRCLWAQELNKDISVHAQNLANQWSPEQGNYTMSLVNGTRYGYLKQAINALVDSLASIETVKDRKLGRPMGRHAECTSDKCPQDVEHKYSGLSLQAVSAQLTALRNIFTGGNGMGLDDALIKANRTDVARNFLSAIDEAQASVEAAIQQGTLQEQIEAVDATLCKETTQEDRKASICAVHADIRQVASVLKTEVIVALALTAPPAHQGDKD